MKQLDGEKLETSKKQEDVSRANVRTKIMTCTQSSKQDIGDTDNR